MNMVLLYRSMCPSILYLIRSLMLLKPKMRYRQTYVVILISTCCCSILNNLTLDVNCDQGVKKEYDRKALYENFIKSVFRPMNIETTAEL